MKFVLEIELNPKLLVFRLSNGNVSLYLELYFKNFKVLTEVLKVIIEQKEVIIRNLPNKNSISIETENSTLVSKILKIIDGNYNTINKWNLNPDIFKNYNHFKSFLTNFSKHEISKDIIGLFTKLLIDGICET